MPESAKFYYSTNADGTTYDGFVPFTNDSVCAEAPDWIDDDRECGHGLHVVSENPLRALLFVSRGYQPKFYEVQPFDLKPEVNGKYRCRALRRIREVPYSEIFQNGPVIVHADGNQITFGLLDGQYIVKLRSELKTERTDWDWIVEDGTPRTVSSRSLVNNHASDAQWSRGWNADRLTRYREAKKLGW